MDDLFFSLGNGNDRYVFGSTAPGPSDVSDKASTPSGHQSPRSCSSRPAQHVEDARRPGIGRHPDPACPRGQRHLRRPGERLTDGAHGHVHRRRRYIGGRATRGVRQSTRDGHLGDRWPGPGGPGRPRGAPRGVPGTGGRPRSAPHRIGQETPPTTATTATSATSGSMLDRTRDAVRDTIGEVV